MKKVFIKVGQHIASFIIWSFLIVAALASGIYFSNNIIVTDVVSNTGMNVKIVQISDVHDKVIEKRIAEKINEQNPDILIINGDLVDSRKTTEFTEDYLLKQFDGVKAPIYYVPGEMEKEYGRWNEFKKKVKDKNIKILENKSEKIEIKGKTITLTGIVDPAFYYEDLDTWTNKLKKLKIDNGEQILISHRPELMDIYTRLGFKHVLCGHTHGGYIQIPFIGPLFIMNQGLMPNYVEGMYKQEDTTMIVTSGIGNGVFPIRLFTQPEIQVIE